MGTNFGSCHILFSAARLCKVKQEPRGTESRGSFPRCHSSVNEKHSFLMRISNIVLRLNYSFVLCFIGEKSFIVNVKKRIQSNCGTKSYSMSDKQLKADN